MDVLAPDAGCREITADGRTYKADRRGVYRDVPDSVARRMILRGNAAARGEGFGRVRGFVCIECAFRSLFVRCGRCGGRCERS